MKQIDNYELDLTGFKNLSGLTNTIASTGKRKYPYHSICLVQRIYGKNGLNPLIT